MKFGVSLFPTSYSIRPVEAARAAEDAGFESIWFPEHTHLPVETRFPMGDGTVPRDYKSMLDPFVALATAASVTSTIRLCTGIALIIQRDPFTLAKEVATLDLLSGGRVILGIGAGWNLREMRNHGTNPDTRFKLMRERVEALKALWTQDEAEYHGELVDFGPVWSYPKPVQQPHPPIVLGGTGPNVLKRVLAYGDGWAPIVGQLSDDRLASSIATLREGAAAAGRPAPEVTLYGVPPEPAGIARYASLGVERAVWGLSTDGAEAALAQIAGYKRVLGAL